MIRTRYNICSKVTLKTAASGVFVVNLALIIVFLLNLSKSMPVVKDSLFVEAV